MRDQQTTIPETILSESAINELKAKLRGELIRPGDADYEEARKVWNGMIDKRPALVARCAGVDDVVLAVNFAKTNHLPLAVRGGGHNVAGFGSCDDGLVIDLCNMKRITIDPKSKSARVQPGLTLGELDKATQEFSLAMPGGMVSSTGIAGYTLGGGIGWLVRKYGFTVDNLLSVEITTAAGKVLRADRARNVDLFWALRGGGGNFGVVTEFEYRLHDVGPKILGGPLVYDAWQAERILGFYEKWAESLPVEFTTLVEFGTAPVELAFPERLRGAKVLYIALCYCGLDFKHARQLMQPMLDFMEPAMNMVGEMLFVDLQRMFDAGMPKGVRSYWKTAYLRGLSPEAIRVLVQGVEEMPPGLSLIDLHPIKGAAYPISDSETAFPHRDAPHVLNIVGLWHDAKEDSSGRSWVRSTWESLQPYSTGEQYLNFMSVEPEEQVKAAFGSERYDRLVQVKRKYDPSNLFRLNQNIKP